LLKRTVSGMTLILLLANVLMFPFNVPPVKAEPGTIYIRADGSIDPPTAPIERNGDLYALTAGINSAVDGIVIERDNVIFDGAGYAVQASVNRSGSGILLSERRNVTIRNTQIKSFGFGIWLNHSFFNSISGSNVTNNDEGIHLASSSSNNYISGNDIIGNRVFGICFDFSSSNSVIGNNITANDLLSGIWLSGSDCNIIRGNYVTANNDHGIWLLSSWSNSITENNITANYNYGIDLTGSAYNKVYRNNIVDDFCGINLHYSGNNDISENNVIANDFSGIELLYSSYWNNISANNISNGGFGIYLSGYGSPCPSNNIVHHNNFTNNAQHALVQDPSCANTWDNGYPSGGNYWSDYADVDLNNDGIWDHPYVIDANNTDRYPLVHPWTPAPPPKFRIDDWVQTITNLNVREGPGLDYTVINTMPLDTIGRILGGPLEADGFVWWNVNYTVGVRGWSAENWLELAPFADLLPEIIQQEMQEYETVTVDGREYHIVTLERYISPLTWEPSDYTFLSHAPDIRKIYTDTHFIPITERQLLEKIGIIDRANNLLKHIGKPDSVQNQIEAINTVFAADSELANAELTAEWAQYIVFTTLDLSISIELEQPLSIANEVSSFLMDKLEHYATPQQFMLEMGRALLEGAKRDYEQAKIIAEGNAEGINDYNVAYNYLNDFYNGHFKMVYGVDAVLPRGRIDKNPFWDIAGWIPDYILHLGSLLTSHFPILQELFGTVEAAKIESEAIENMDDFRQFIDNVNGIPDKVAQMLEDESFPIDYSQALAYQNMTLLARWGIVGVEEINVKLACPAELGVYDLNGDVTGIMQGGIRMEIPNSFYYNNTVTIFLPNETYTIEVTGTDAGTYQLEASFVEDKGITSFVAIDLPTSSNVTHQYAIDWTALSRGEEGASVQVDSNGDGFYEYNFTSDSELSRFEYVAATTGHDLGITGIDSPKTIIGKGYTLPVNATIVNYGAYAETFNITIYANTTVVTSQTLTLTSGNFTTISFAWNTSGFAKGNYIINAVVDNLPGEAYTLDNSLTSGWVTVTIAGDITSITPGIPDYRVDMRDIGALCNKFMAKPSNPNWDPNYDINGDGVVNMRDIGIACNNFMKT
jgi:parallel beta-helix repeat protein